MRIYSLRRVLIPTLMGLTFAAATPAEPSQDKTTKPKSSAVATATHASSKSKSGTALAKLDLRSSSVLIVDAEDASVLYARQAKRVAPVASITKLMTALVVLEGKQPLEELIEVTSADRDTEHGSGSRLRVGTRLSRGDLLHLALMSSENRAAHAVARSYPGGITEFVRAMNTKARALGMKTARFVDPTGLSSENVSSAADLTKLVLAASEDPVIQSFSTHESHTVTVGKQLLEFRNTNSLVTKPDWDISVQKTGYTQAAGRCLVMKTLIQGRSVVIVLLNSVGKYTRVADVRRIRKWMEAADQQTTLAGVNAS